MKSKGGKILVFILGLCFACLAVMLFQYRNNSPPPSDDGASSTVEIEPLKLATPSESKGYCWRGEIPPYRKGAPWCHRVASRAHVNNVPECLHEALYFNNRRNFMEFASRYKDELKSWISKVFVEKKEGDELAKYMLKKIEESNSNNRAFLEEEYTGLTTKQYLVLNAMNLTHGNYMFGTVHHVKEDPASFINQDEADCSEMANLLAILLEIQGIDVKIMGYSWCFNALPHGKSTGTLKFVSSHRLILSEGMIVDPLVNIAFDVGGNYSFRGIPKAERLEWLIKNGKIYGFYNWFIKPEIRAALHEKQQDGGVIAFFYYYYFFGMDEGDCKTMHYKPYASFKAKRN